MAVPSLSLSGDKIAQRRRAREERRLFVSSMSPEARIRLEEALASHLSPLLANARQIGAYAPLHDEISPMPAVEMARSKGIAVAFPTFADHNSPFRFLVGEPVESGPFGILQPAADNQEIRPDLILVPLVAIDRCGNRLGQGKGHYDRVLPDLRRNGSLMIGLGWTAQRIDDVFVAENWDVAMDGFASPDGLEMFR